MANEKFQKGPDAPKPVCPHCLKDPCDFTVSPMSIGLMQTIAIYCGNPECRKVFGVSFVGVRQQEEKQIVVAKPGTRF